MRAAVPLLAPLSGISTAYSMSAGRMSLLRPCPDILTTISQSRSQPQRDSRTGTHSRAHPTTETDWDRPGNSNRLATARNGVENR